MNEAHSKHAESLYRSVVDEIDRIQNSQSTLKSAVLFLAISIAAFVVAGYFAWDLRFLLFLIPIMFFHELGHFVAMKIFGYRDVKMFFVPLLGAAVSGKNYNIAGWKKVLVFLAGPLPGLLLAIPMAMGAVIWDIRILREVALMNVFLNALNLLPVIPLDGGRIMHTIFFSRNAKLDVACRIVASLFLILSGVAIGEWFFVLLGGIMVIAVPSAFQNSRVAESLKLEFGDSLITEGQDVPLETTRRIVDRLPTDGPHGQPRNLAVRTLQIFENINCRPPGARATIGLTLLYCAGWLMAGLTLAILFIAPRIDRFTEPPSSDPIAFAAPLETVARNGQSTGANTSDGRLLLAEFDSNSTASNCYNEIRDSDVAVAQAGSTIWVWMKGDSESTTRPPYAAIAQTALRARSIDHHNDLLFDFSFDAPDQQSAEQLQTALVVWCQYGALSNAIEPWSPQHRLSEQHLKARQTLGRLMDIERQIDENAELIALYDESVNSTDSQFAKAAMEQFVRQSHQMRQRLMKAELWESNNDKAVVELFMAPDHLHDPGADQQALENTSSKLPEWGYQKWLKSMGALLGEIPSPVGVNAETADVETANAAQDLRYHSLGGYVARDGQRVSIQAMAFTQPIDGLPALLDWLHKSGCQQVNVTVTDHRFPSLP